ncbi:hypothetical protein D187_009837 [Cystobacter fuscus DSM 2262]|uniref:Uncharacterized protein n=1 Tax=Cystobacter fuscus (strain ATCC 25194 / DSM 2262 / NBRC 100088 / M29) TaxID=1242864 RepID=S9QKW9_CYSF2|nr:hypothetical protein D187_009837 [Cystobacter fuscus DSM 2262]
MEGTAFALEHAESGLIKSHRRFPNKFKRLQKCRSVGRRMLAIAILACQRMGKG